MFTLSNQNNDQLGVYPTLDEAMQAAKQVTGFVKIKGQTFEALGIFGVDSVEDGKCPDGVAYDWNKASRIGRVKKERV